MRKSSSTSKSWCLTLPLTSAKADLKEVSVAAFQQVFGNITVVERLLVSVSPQYAVVSLCPVNRRWREQAQAEGEILAS